MGNLLFPESGAEGWSVTTAKYAPREIWKLLGQLGEWWQTSLGEAAKPYQGQLPGTQPTDPLQAMTAEWLSQTGGALQQAIANEALTRATRSYYESLRPELERDIAQRLEQAGMGGARFSSGAASSIGEATEGFYSNLMNALLAAKKAEMFDAPQVMAQLASQAGGLGRQLWEQAGAALAAPYEEWKRQAYYPMELMTPAASLLSALKQKKAKTKSESTGSSGGCCFIFIEAANGTLHPVVRLYRDRKLRLRNRRGYYWLSDRLVPRMRKWRWLKEIVRLVMTRPMTCYGLYFYGFNRIGALLAPVAAMWLLLFSILGLRGPYRRAETGEVV